jgi:hypothetical protein
MAEAEKLLTSPRLMKSTAIKSRGGGGGVGASNQGIGKHVINILIDISPPGINLVSVVIVLS